MTARKPHPMAADIAPLLKLDLSNAEIARRLYVSPGVVARVRADLGMPPYRQAPENLRTKFERHTTTVDDGHMVWTGQRTQDLVPVLSHGSKSRITARRVAYRLAHGREPVGNVASTCQYEWCVAPACQADNVDRDRALATGPQLDAAAALLGVE
ncbi:hypothetical protein ACFRDV_22375 [Streptomyces fagopyri]|uniref:hypothetical protein n=1 Tax=Streptomyces fagopyri TaxID=2662397 RepID=UPI0036AA7194